MKLKTKQNEKNRVEYIERIDGELNWIESYKSKHGKKPPPLPNYMLPLVNLYIKGTPITEGIQVIPISGQQWTLLTANEKAELLELVEFTGKDAGDYVRNFEAMFPKDPDFRKRT